MKPTRKHIIKRRHAHAGLAVIVVIVAGAVVGIVFVREEVQLFTNTIAIASGTAIPLIMEAME